MRFFTVFGYFAIVIACTRSSLAHADIAGGVLCTKDDPCHSRGIFTNKSAGPKKSDAVKVNPAEVPVEKITGVETIYYKGSFDFGLVQGLGRIGAAISPSNNDETFFGPPAVEANDPLLDRMNDHSKYDAGKYTFATAVNLYAKEGSGFSHINLNLGVIGRYEVATRHVKPGLGLQLISGPVYVAGSYYDDENQIKFNDGSEPRTLTTAVSAYSIGLSLNSVLIDYSMLRVTGDEPAPATASVISFTTFVNRYILTLARREVNSPKPAYDFVNKVLLREDSKVDIFLGAQARVATFLVLGAFYNYYLLHEISFGATIFF